jgi:hypothetical protein
MAKQFTFQDNLGSILSSSPKPFFNTLDESVYDGFEDYMKLDMSEYDIYSENANESPYKKYTIISKHQQTPILTRSNTISPNSRMKKNEQLEKEVQTDTVSESVPQVPDVFASKIFEESKMSTINTVYIGSLTIIGLYVLFRYMKY